MCDVLLKFDLRVKFVLFEKYTGISATLLTSLIMRLNLFWKLSDTNAIGTNIGVCEFFYSVALPCIEETVQIALFVAVTMKFLH